MYIRYNNFVFQIKKKKYSSKTDVFYQAPKHRDFQHFLPSNICPFDTFTTMNDLLCAVNTYTQIHVCTLVNVSNREMLGNKY